MCTSCTCVLCTWRGPVRLCVCVHACVSASMTCACECMRTPGRHVPKAGSECRSERKHSKRTGTECVPRMQLADAAVRTQERRPDAGFGGKLGTQAGRMIRRTCFQFIAAASRRTARTFDASSVRSLADENGSSGRILHYETSHDLHRHPCVCMCAHVCLHVCACTSMCMCAFCASACGRTVACACVCMHVCM